MFYLHAKDKSGHKIVILGRKTRKQIIKEKDATYDGHYTLDLAQKEKKLLENFEEKDQFWSGPITIKEIE